MGKNKTNPKLLVLLLGLCIFIISMFQKYVVIASLSGKIQISMNTADINGTLFVAIGIIIILYSLKKQDGIISLIGYLVSLGGYTYAFASTIKALNLSSDSIEISFGIGFYLYIISAIILLISVFVKKEKIIIDNENYNVEKLDTDSFILCNMLLGIKEIPYNSLLLLKKSDSNLSIEYQYEEKINNYLIPLNTIKDISSTQDMAIDYSSNELEDFNSANTLLSYSLLAGHPLAAMGANKLLDELTVDYEKGKITSWFIITIKYEQDGEIHELKFKTKKNPQKFIEKLKNME